MALGPQVTSTVKQLQFLKIARTPRGVRNSKRSSHESSGASPPPSRPSSTFSAAGVPYSCTVTERMVQESTTLPVWARFPVDAPSRALQTCSTFCWSHDSCHMIDKHPRSRIIAPLRDGCTRIIDLEQSTWLPNPRKHLQPLHLMSPWSPANKPVTSAALLLCFICAQRLLNCP